MRQRRVLREGPPDGQVHATMLLPTVSKFKTHHGVEIIQRVRSSNEGFGRLRFCLIIETVRGHRLASLVLNDKRPDPLVVRAIFYKKTLNR
jgi:hypothetical protein